MTSVSFFQCRLCRAVVGDSATRLSVDKWVFSDAQFERAAALSSVYARACRTSDELRVERLADTSGMALRGVACVACNNAIGRLYVSSGDAQFDWQRGVVFLDARAVAEHVVQLDTASAAAAAATAAPTAASTIAAGAPSAATLRRALPSEPEQLLQLLVHDDQRFQVIFQGMQEQTRATVDSVAALEQRLAEQRLLPRVGQWACTVPGCRETFTREHRLRRHEHVAHGRAGRVTCAAMFCTRDFATAADMEAHMLDAHSDVVERSVKRGRRSLVVPQQHRVADE